MSDFEYMALFTFFITAHVLECTRPVFFTVITTMRTSRSFAYFHM